MKHKSWYRPGKTIHVSDKMQTGYNYVLKRPYGDMSDVKDVFQPALTPPQMLCLGVFEGKYLNDCVDEFPMEWYIAACKLGKLSPMRPNPKCNLFGIKSRQPLSEWRRKHWIYGPDVRGWFQWYCRFYLGRRDPVIDTIQIKRWRSFRRHFGQVQKNCSPEDVACRPKQRQALLQWSYNPLIEESALSRLLQKKNILDLS